MLKWDLLKQGYKEPLFFTPDQFSSDLNANALGAAKW